jgi:hypothetical protein
MELIKENDPLDVIIQKADRFDQLQYIILICVKLYLVADDIEAKKDKENTVKFLKDVTSKVFFDKGEIEDLIKKGTETVYNSQFFTNKKLPGGKLFADCKEVLQPLFEKPKTVEVVREFVKTVNKENAKIGDKRTLENSVF